MGDRRRKDLNMKIVKTRVRQSGGGSGALYVIPVKLLAHETQTTMAMCLSAGEKTTMTKCLSAGEKTTMAMCLSAGEKTTQAMCLSANTNNNGTVFICSRGI